MKKDQYIAGVNAVFVAGWVDASLASPRDATKYPGQFAGAYACGYDLIRVKDMVQPFVIQTASNGFDDGAARKAKRSPVMPSTVVADAQMIEDFSVVYSDAYTAGMLEVATPSPPVPTPADETEPPAEKEPLPPLDTSKIPIEFVVSNAGSIFLGTVFGVLATVGGVYVFGKMKRATANPSLNPGHVWLQGIGWVKGKPAGELAVGDKLLWNRGYVSTVQSVERASKQFVVVTEKLEDGSTYDRKMKLDRLVGIAK